MAKRKRFPRLVMDAKSVSAERILHITYNKMRKSRGIRFQNFKYDIYKTKQGWRAKLAFIFLGEKLILQNIDPALYIKVMCRYGKYKNSKYMPHPTWLRKDKTIKTFKWLYRKERKSYDLHLDWKKAIDGWSDLDIYSSIRDSAELLNTAVEKMQIGKEEAFMVLRKELSPWFMAVHALKDKDGWKDFRNCLTFLGRHGHVRHIAYKAYRKTFRLQNSNK